MNDLDIKANELFFEAMILKYPHLNSLKLDNNILSFADYKINLGNFRLINFNKNQIAFSLSPYDFFNLVKIHIDILEEQNYIKNEEYNNDIVYMQIGNIIFKESLNEEDLKILQNFISAYKTLLSYQDYLIDHAIIKLNKMSNFIYDLVNNPYVKQTEGIKLLMEIKSQEAQSNSKGPKLILSNPKFPSMNNDEENYLLPKSGYASIILLIYVVINIGFILAVILLN